MNSNVHSFQKCTVEPGLALINIVTVAMLQILSKDNKAHYRVLSSPRLMNIWLVQISVLALIITHY